MGKFIQNLSNIVFCLVLLFPILSNGFSVEQKLLKHLGKEFERLDKDDLVNLDVFLIRSIAELLVNPSRLVITPSQNQNAAVQKELTEKEGENVTGTNEVGTEKGREGAVDLLINTDESRLGSFFAHLQKFSFFKMSSLEPGYEGYISKAKNRLVTKMSKYRLTKSLAEDIDKKIDSSFIQKATIDLLSKIIPNKKILMIISQLIATNNKEVSFRVANEMVSSNDQTNLSPMNQQMK